MTFDEIKQIPDLQIEVTPAVEDAFHFLYGLDKHDVDITDAQARCGEHLTGGSYTKAEQKEAVRRAYKMIENINKYGVACAAWV